MFSFIPVFPSTGILFSCSHHSILVLFHSYSYFIYISIISISFLFYFHSILVLFHSYFYFIYVLIFLFLLYSVSPEFSVHFTKKMRPNGEELPKLCLCDIGRHKLMHCDIVTLVKGGRSCGNGLVKLLRK